MKHDFPRELISATEQNQPRSHPGVTVHVKELKGRVVALDQDLDLALGSRPGEERRHGHQGHAVGTPILGALVGKSGHSGRYDELGELGALGELAVATRGGLFDVDAEEAGGENVVEERGFFWSVIG
jgi:hypothetical protein